MAEKLLQNKLLFVRRFCLFVVAVTQGCDNGNSKCGQERKGSWKLNWVISTLWATHISSGFQFPIGGPTIVDTG